MSSSTSAHQRKSSSQSTFSALSDDFTTKVETKMNNSEIGTEQYVETAGHHLGEMESDDRRLGDFSSSLSRIKVDPHKVLKSMLQYAPTKHGERYVACAILACDRELDQQVDLANTWLRYLLLPVKANSDRSREFDPRYQCATPTLGDKATSISSIPANRKSLRNDIIFRDGFQCQLTGWYDYQAKKDLVPRIGLEVAHIMKRALAVFDRQTTECASVTWEIIRQYAHWSDKKLTAMINLINSSENGFMVEGNHHRVWDTFGWTLAPVMTSEQVPIPNAYSIEVLRPHQMLPFPLKDIITFQDLSVTDKEYLMEELQGYLPKPRSGVSLPNPELIALHRAMANVLHVSGAGQAISLAMNRVFSNGIPMKAMDADSLALQLSVLHLMETIALDAEHAQENGPKPD